MWSYLALPGAIWSSLELSAAVCSYLQLSAAIYSQLSGAIWSYLELSAAICSYLQLSAAIWAKLQLPKDTKHKATNAQSKPPTHKPKSRRSAEEAVAHRCPPTPLWRAKRVEYTSTNLQAPKPQLDPPLPTPRLHADDLRASSFRFVRF